MICVRFPDHILLTDCPMKSNEVLAYQVGFVLQSWAALFEQRLFVATYSVFVEMSQP